jgi:D-tyrosyl-tRNA(Tyr) deacylase
MRAVVQRVSEGCVSVGNAIIASIGIGLVILLGIAPDDTHAKAQALAQKIARLRIFEDGQGKMNGSILDVGGSALVISQFTLYADTHKGNRPSFIKAALPAMAEPLYDQFVASLRAEGVAVKEGKFGAHMQVEIHNDGPVTIWLDL